MTGARQTALSALIACRTQGAWSDGILREYIVRDRLDRRDAALATRLCYGVLQNRLLLDFWLEQVVTGSLDRLQPNVLEILRLGLYQLRLMDRIPVSAAVNESVELCKKTVNQKAASLVNASLRAAARQQEIPEPPGLSVRYSHPKELTELIADSVGPDRLEQVLQADNEAPPTCVQINPLKMSPADAELILRISCSEAEPHPWLKNCFLVRGSGSIDQLQLYRDGTLYVQDAAARLAVTAAELKPGMTVLDCCAAPGGKSFAAAIDMENRGMVVSCDIHAHKIELLKKGAQRLGLSIIRPQLQDASQTCEDWEGEMDAVLCDVPCSGLGVIRGKPDIRYKDVPALAGLPAIQKRILAAQADHVIPGGVLIYSTCTILKRENEDVVRDFLQKRPDFMPELFRLPDALGGGLTAMRTILPGEAGCDGFFIAKLRRKPQ